MPPWLLWDFDTGRSFDAVNGAPAQGGQVTGWPIVIANGRVFVTSGAVASEAGECIAGLRAKPPDEGRLAGEVTPAGLLVTEP